MNTRVFVTECLISFKKIERKSIIDGVVSGLNQDCIRDVRHHMCHKVFNGKVPYGIFEQTHIRSINKGLIPQTMLMLKLLLVSQILPYFNYDFPKDRVNQKLILTSHHTTKLICCLRYFLISVLPLNLLIYPGRCENSLSSSKLSCASLTLKRALSGIILSLSLPISSRNYYFLLVPPKRIRIIVC